MVAFRDRTYAFRVQIPLVENTLHDRFIALFHHHKHALLRLTEEDFKRLHIRLSQWHFVQINVHAHSTGSRHFRGRASDARRAHVLHAAHRIGSGEFEGRLKQQLFLERIANLHGWQILCTLSGDVFRGERSALDAVLSGG